MVTAARRRAPLLVRIRERDGIEILQKNAAAGRSFFHFGDDGRLVDGEGPLEITTVRDGILGGSRDSAHTLDELGFLVLDNLGQDVGDRF
jgi:hypothetical protein